MEVEGNGHFDGKVTLACYRLSSVYGDFGKNTFLFPN